MSGSEEQGVVLVTGGSGGIGEAVVARLVAEGAHVAFTYRNGEAEAERVEKASRGRAKGFQVDLADRSAWARWIREVEETFAPVAGLVHCAGVTSGGLLAFTSDDEWDRVLDLNLGAAFRGAREVVRALLRRGGGSLVYVASLSAVRGVPGQAAYAASKAGVVAMMRSLAREMGSKRIRVNAVLPGFVDTPMTRRLDDEEIARLRSGECLPDGVTPAHVAAVASFLLSSDAAAITGQTVVVDAGASI